MEGNSPQRALVDRLGSSIEGATLRIWASRVVAYESPAHWHDLSRVRVSSIADDGLCCGGSDVVARNVGQLVANAFRVEVVGDGLLILDPIVAAAHGKA